jgi:hypothetical protein
MRKGRKGFYSVKLRGFYSVNSVVNGFLWEVYGFLCALCGF